MTLDELVERLLSKSQPFGWYEDKWCEYSNPNGPEAASRLLAMQEALEPYEKAVRECPYAKSPSPDSKAPCRVCGAVKNEGCCRQITAALEAAAILSPNRCKQGSEMMGFGAISRSRASRRAATRLARSGFDRG
jgi:hypothetical protein